MQVCFVNCTVCKCKQNNMMYTSQIAFICLLTRVFIKSIILFCNIYNTVSVCCSKFEIMPRIYFILNVLKHWFLIIYIIYIVDIIIVYVPLYLVDMQM